MSPDALTGLANLGYNGRETMASRDFERVSAWQNWIFIRPNAVAEPGALKEGPIRFQPRSSPATDSPFRPFLRNAIVSNIDYSEKIPTTSTCRKTRPCSARSNAGNRTTCSGGTTWTDGSTSFDVDLHTAINITPEGRACAQAQARDRGRRCRTRGIAQFPGARRLFLDAGLPAGPPHSNSQFRARLQRHRD
jgi:hypothetical protein